MTSSLWQGRYNKGHIRGVFTVTSVEKFWKHCLPGLAFALVASVLLPAPYAALAGVAAGQLPIPALPSATDRPASAAISEPRAGEPPQTSLDFPLPPPADALKERPSSSQIFQVDTQALGSRTPLLMIHGGNGENLELFHWGKAIAHFNGSADFQKKY